MNNDTVGELEKKHYLLQVVSSFTQKKIEQYRVSSNWHQACWHKRLSLFTVICRYLIQYADEWKRYIAEINTADVKATSLALKKERRATLGPPALVAATRHIETRDSLVPVSIVVDWYRDALALRIRVSSIL